MLLSSFRASNSVLMATLFKGNHSAARDGQGQSLADKPWVNHPVQLLLGTSSGTHDL